MRKVSGVGHKDWRYAFYRYKDSAYYTQSVISAVFIVSLLLIFYVITPQFQNWFSIRNEVIATRERIEIIRGNINFMNNLDRTVLDSQFETVVSALPADKEFTKILDVISEAALNSGVAIDDYSFRLGDISTVSEDEEQENNVSDEKDLLIIQLSVFIDSDAQDISIFLKELNQKLPLSEVVEVDRAASVTRIDVQFYYKKLPDIVFEHDKPIAPISDEEKEFIKEISAWKPVFSSEDFTTTPTGTSSSIPLF